MTEGRKPLTLSHYQREAAVTAIYPREVGLLYTVLGLTNEAGEVAGKVKKAIRDDSGMISPERQEALEAELGDVLWYVAMTARELDVDLGTIAKQNLAKLRGRKARGAIGGSGDTR